MQTDCKTGVIFVQVECYRPVWLMYQVWPGQINEIIEKDWHLCCLEALPLLISNIC